MPDDLSGVADKVTLFTLLDVLEHIENDQAFLADLVHMAPKGANILITVPAMKSLWSPHDVANHHFRRYEMSELTGTWAGLPVECRMVGYYCAKLYPIIRMMRALANIRSQSVGEGGSDFSLPSAPLNRFLTSVFESETDRLVNQIDHPEAASYRAGSSLMAVLRKA
ncbi:putative SAM-dependent methyltransferase (fragment) [Magnetospira sp. QH-2]